MSDYKKMKSHELAELLVRRGLDAGGTKVQMMSRLVMQDTEQIAADKALAAAIQAASTNLSPQTNSGNSNNEEAGKWSKVKSGGADRGGADQAGDKRRKVRMEKGRQTGKGKANDIGGVGYYGVLGEDKKDMTKAGDVDEDAYVKELLAGGAMDGRKAGPVSQHKNGIVVNMTEATPAMRRAAGRTRSQRKTSSTRPVSDDDDDAFSDASTIRPSSFVAPERIPLPEGDDDDLKKSGKGGKKRPKLPKKNRKTGAQANGLTVHHGTVHGSPSLMKMFLYALFITMVYILLIILGSMTKAWSYVVAFLKNPMGFIWESITGRK